VEILKEKNSNYLKKLEEHILKSKRGLHQKVGGKLEDQNRNVKPSVCNHILEQQIIYPFFFFFFFFYYTIFSRLFACIYELRIRLSFDLRGAYMGLNVYDMTPGGEYMGLNLHVMCKYICNKVILMVKGPHVKV
jgi:hypothetical protein